MNCGGFIWCGCKLCHSISNLKKNYPLEVLHGRTFVISWNIVYGEINKIIWDKMDSLPLTLVKAVNSALQEGKSLSWRVHGGDDKVMMNIMWTRTKKSLTVRPVKPLLVVGYNYTRSTTFELYFSFCSYMELRFHYKIKLIIGSTSACGTWPLLFLAYVHVYTVGTWSFFLNRVSSWRLY